MAAVLSPLLLDDPSPPRPAAPKRAPAPAPTSAPAPSDEALTEEETAGEAAAEAAARRQSLARQRRGRLGTIATSARGILRTAQAPVQRRSLLGE